MRLGAQLETDPHLVPSYSDQGLLEYAGALQACPGGGREVMCQPGELYCTSHAARGSSRRGAAGMGCQHNCTVCIAHSFFDLGDCGWSHTRRSAEVGFSNGRGKPILSGRPELHDKPRSCATLELAALASDFDWIRYAGEREARGIDIHLRISQRYSEPFIIPRKSVV